MNLETKKINDKLWRSIKKEDGVIIQDTHYRFIDNKYVKDGKEIIWFNDKKVEIEWNKNQKKVEITYSNEENIIKKVEFGNNEIIITLFKDIPETILIKKTIINKKTKNSTELDVTKINKDIKKQNQELQLNTQKKKWEIINNLNYEKNGFISSTWKSLEKNFCVRFSIKVKKIEEKKFNLISDFYIDFLDKNNQKIDDKSFKKENKRYGFFSENGLIKLLQLEAENYIKSLNEKQKTERNSVMKNMIFRDKKS